MRHALRHLGHEAGILIARDKTQLLDRDGIEDGGVGTCGRQGSARVQRGPLAYSGDIRHDGRAMMMTTPALVLALLAPQAAPKPEPKPMETREWRQNRETELKEDRGWLAVSGLPWFKEGETSIGSGESASIRVADGPAVWGTFTRTGANVTLRQGSAEAREITTRDEPFLVGRTWVQLIKRSDLVGLRMWDPQNARKLAFHGLQWFDIKPDYKVKGKLVPSAIPSSVKIANVIGQVNDFVSPGVVEFELDGKKLQLTPVYETPAHDELFYIFKDATAAKMTYGAGRFVYSGLPDKDGVVILDFNRAYSPPCAFTDFATCPLPPPQNRLTVAIEAGEKDPHRAH